MGCRKEHLRDILLPRDVDPLEFTGRLAADLGEAAMSAPTKVEGPDTRPGADVQDPLHITVVLRTQALAAIKQQEKEVIDQVCRADC